MVGAFVAMAVSIGSAAAVLAVLARRNAPEGGWREVIEAGFQAARHKDLPLVDHPGPDDGDDGSLDDLLAVAAPGDGPTYSEATAVRQAIEAARRAVRREGSAAS